MGLEVYDELVLLYQRFKIVHDKVVLVVLQEVVVGFLQVRDQCFH